MLPRTMPSSRGCRPHGDRQVLPVQRFRLGETALLAVHDAENAQGKALGTAVALRPMNRKRCFDRLPRLVHLSLLPHDSGELAQSQAFGVRIATLAEGGERGPQQVLSFAHPPAFFERRCPDDGGGIACRSVDPFDAEHLPCKHGAQRERSLELEHAPGRPAGCERDGGIRARQRSPACAHEIVELQRQGTLLPRSAARREGVDCSSGPEARVVRPVPFLGGAARMRTALDELCRRVLVNRQVHTEVRLVDGVATDVVRGPRSQQALVDQRLDDVALPGAPRGTAPDRSRPQPLPA